MNRAVPAAARELALQLQEAFAQDQQLARQLNDAQQRLQSANTRLWSGLHPDALALLYDDTHAIGIDAPGAIRSEVAAVMIDALRDGADEQQLEATVLALVQEIHWTIHARSPTTKTSPSAAAARGGHRRADRPIHRRARRGRMV